MVKKHVDSCREGFYNILASPSSAEVQTAHLEGGSPLNQHIHTNHKGNSAKNEYIYIYKFKSNTCIAQLA